MTCTEKIKGLVEYARRGVQPPAELRAHLSACLACAERWHSELRLAEGLRSVRAVAANRSEATREIRREALLHEFDRRQPVVLAPPARQRPALSKLTWMLAAAAALVFAIVLGHSFGVRSRPAALPATRIRALPQPQSILYQASSDASRLSGEDFIAVPYTSPLAEGELVRVIHADLYPEALTSLGIDYDPAAGSTVPAELVVGEDGLPRAVRITEATQY